MSTSDPIVYEGGCLCGEIRWRAVGPSRYLFHCHCGQCRRHTGSAFASAAGFAPEAVRWLNAEPTFYQSSPDAKRGFCARCGSSISWHHRDGEIALYLGSFDRPEALRPDAHMMAERQLPWLEIDDGLPRYPRFPPGDEGLDQDL